MCLPSLVKICNSLAAVTVGFITFALIVEEAVIAPEENCFIVTCNLKMIHHQMQIDPLI